MSPEHGQKLRRIFEAALDRPSEERDAFLREVCAADPDLHKEVVSLLNAHEHGHAFFEKPALAQFSPSADSSDWVPLPAGTLIAERFEIQALLGRGGMGEVYQANDRILRRIVALKFLISYGAGDPSFRRRLQSEARALAALRHPNICTVYDVCSHNDRDFLVMEYLDGETLATRLRRGGPPGIGDFVRTVQQVCSALEFAHGRGILHRDLKPANIMLTSDGAKLLDFGIATFSAVESHSLVAETSGDKSVSLATTALAAYGFAGTVQYMSPEQTRGESLDGRSDVFSLGVVMYEMATRSVPFCGDTAGEVVDAILNKQPLPVRRLDKTIPVHLEFVIGKCLKKSREQRYESAAAVGASLRPMAELLGRAAPNDAVASDFRPGAKATQAWFVAALIGLVVALVVFLQIDIRSALNLQCTRSEAIRLARQAASDMGYSVEGLKERVAFNAAVDLERVLTQHGTGITRQLVRSGRGFAWEVDLTSGGGRADDDSGLSMRIDTAGRLLEFHGKRKSATMPATAETLEKIATDAVRNRLGFSILPAPAMAVTSPSRGTIEVSWTIPVATTGWHEQVEAAVAGGQVYMLNRRVVTANAPSTPDVAKPGKIVDSGSVLQRVNQAQLTLALYGYGIWVFIKWRRFLSLPWRSPIFLTLSSVLGFVWFIGSHASQSSATPTGWRMLDRALTVALLLLPSIVGLYGSLCYKDGKRVLTLEALLRGEIGDLAISRAIKDGVSAGGVLACIYLVWSTVVQVGVHLPDISYLAMGIRGDTPWRFGEVGLAFMTGLITIAVATTYTVLKRLTRRDWLGFLLTAILLAFWDLDVHSPRTVVDFLFGADAICCQLMVYRTCGLMAALVANLSSRFIVGGLVGMHLGNRQFFDGALVMLAIPTALLGAAALLPEVLRRYQTIRTE